MTAEDDLDAEGAFLAGLREQAEAMADAPQPYAIAWELWSLSMAGMVSVGRWSPAPQPHWMIWGALTDRVEVLPDEKAQAESMMRRAAAEWLAIAEDRAAWAAFFDRWIYGECGYTRLPE